MSEQRERPEGSQQTDPLPDDESGEGLGGERLPAATFLTRAFSPASLPVKFIFQLLERSDEGIKTRCVAEDHN